MTPQLQQAIKLLQLSNIDLSAFVEQELERNPLLERADDGAEPGEFDKPEMDGDDGDRQSLALESDLPVDDPAAIELDGVTPPAGGQDLASPKQALDTDANDVYSHDSPTDAPIDVSGDGIGISTYTGSSSGGGYPDGEQGFENTLSRDISLKEHIIQQVNVAFTDPAERLIASYLAEFLDEAGYLTEEPDLVAERLGAAPQAVAQVLAKLRGFEPAGVFARNLAECLGAQLHERDRLDPAMADFLDNLDLLGKHDLAELMRRCRVDEEDLRDMVKEIKALNPKPGLAYDSDVAQAVVPDVYVREAPDGGWSVELNTETLPKVLVNARYFASIKGKARDKAEKTYLNECLNTANWLIKSLDQRARTILRVSVELVKQQDGFFVHGITHLRPLNLRAIADAIEMHESTVSRVTANKYMATPRGIFELKYFFTSAISASAGGAAHSAESVRHRIRDLIDAETADSVLSDDKLVTILRQSDIDIARRTVAKYREAMRIPSSVQRRRQKRMNG